MNADGTPSEVYGRFRNKATSGSAAFDALRFGYDSLFKRNEYMHKLSEEELRGLVIEETGQSDESSVPSLVVGSIAALKKFVNEGEFTLGKQLPIDSQPTPAAHFQVSQKPIRPFGMNLSYTINLNLPPTSDIAVFNAIFKSLKENLLRGTDDE